MKFSCVCLVVVVLLNLSSVGRAQGDLNPTICGNTGNYTANSTFANNLNATLSALSFNTSQFGFYTASIGQPPRFRANAAALCRADLRVDECRSCVENAAREIVQICPNQTQAIRWYELCLLRYSDLPINGSTDNAGYILANTGNASNPVQFQQVRRALLDDLRGLAVNGSSLIKVGAGIRSLSDLDTLYALLQCIPTMSSEECNTCLNLAITVGLPPIAQGARRLLPGCTLRYELYPFFNDTRLGELNVLVVQPGSPPSPSPTPGRTDENPTSPPSPSGTNDDNTNRKKDNTIIIVVTIVGAILVSLILLACVVIFLRRRRMKKQTTENPDASEEISTVESLQYDFRDIKAATNDFSDANKLGQGGFGAVYKGTLPNGREIAVKRLSREYGQGDKEFTNEVLLVARLQHRNLVRLLGFSQEGTERLLVYEYVQNASLDQFIFDPVKSSQLDWERRYKIIGGIARGVLYLHEDSRLRIIHRDLKASNVLLDGDLNPKVADFGMAKLFGHDETQGNTSKIVGTYGYMSPEYAIYGQYSVKSDVFSFGVLVMEIICGRKNITGVGENIQDILSFVWKNWCQGTTENIIDPVLKGGASVQEMLRCIHIALLCVQENAEDRPTMNSILVMLSSSTVTLPVPLQPAFVLMSRSNNGAGKDNKVYVSNGTESSGESKKIEYKSDRSSENEMTSSGFYPR